MTNRILGFVKEGTEGTENVDVGTAVTRFGNEAHDRPHPWHNVTLTPSIQEGQLIPRSNALGMKELDFSVKTDFVHPAMIAGACGSVTDLGGTTYRIEFGDPGDIPSYSVYSQVGDDVVVASGCKVEKHALACIAGERITQEIQFMGWQAETHAAITADPPVTWPTGLVNENSKGFHQVSEKEYNDVNLVNLTSMTVQLMNKLDRHGGLGSTTPRGIEQLEGSGVIITFTATLDGTANDLLAKLRDLLDFEEGATNDLEFTFTFPDNTGAGNKTYTFDFHNVMLTEPAPMVPREKVAEYTCVGYCIDDGTNKPFTLVTDDGVDYSAFV